MKTIYLVQAQFSYTEQRCYTVLVSLYCGSLWAYAKEKVDDWVLGEIIYKRESIDELVSRIETVDLVAFCNYVWNKEYNMKLAKAIKLKFPKCHISLEDHKQLKNI